MQRRRTYIKAIGAGIATTVAGCTGTQDGGDGGGQDGGDGGGTGTPGDGPTTEMSQLEEWEAKGKEEGGTVNIAHYLSGQTSEELFAAFQEDIPWLNPQGVKFSGGELFTRFESEYAAGNPTIDMVWTPGVMTLIDGDYMVNLKDALPAYSDLPDDENVKGDYWIPNKTSAQGILYNTELIDEPPTNWGEVVSNPAFQGEITSNGSRWRAMSYHWIMEEHGDGWLEDLSSQNPQLLGTSDGIKRVAAGAIGMQLLPNLKYPWIEGRAKGTPTEIAPVTSFLIPNPTGVNRKAPNKNSALYLANYMASEKGQRKIHGSVYTDCAGLSLDELRCHPSEYQSSLTSKADEFVWAPFLSASELESFLNKWEQILES